MPKCTRNACGQEYVEAIMDPIACQYHPGIPEFHEGLKGWTCCKPRVHSFDDFMEIGGCMLGPHSSEPKHKDDPFKADLTHYDDVLPQAQDAVAPAAAVTAPAPVPRAPAPEPIEEDPEGIPISPGAKCKRSGCHAVYVAEDVSHGPGQCQFHPGTAQFHEGTKGWTCCKPRATDFDEFMQIKGCAHGRHLFVGTTPAKKTLADKCRRDYYQMDSSVIVSVYAKKIDREASSVKFGTDVLSLHLVYGDGKLYEDEIPLAASIDPDASSFEYLSTKVEIKLAKSSPGPWHALEREGYA
ncbi:hypothetical protein GGI04_004601 [Coemansia thaxteri]|uniref:Uncharacterized protein n=1 Tax=Coemansia thaxteri TaxID=2663907 RepID=A0A9W8BJ90_9FUNG|nr:hypothetical protein GGI04_004601 [Coemansia thaxteri]KAJ2003997.1 hypothetical protein H4R26_002762 [Coemansia thaxteri]KAJ2469229.1 hypothetical protein GGI02_003455 [Coemansia sp. RSA 2322]KAJ2478460.1 hypothetical protein EV174_004313 [Coemansia sp. RSA 2320]